MLAFPQEMKKGQISVPRIQNSNYLISSQNVIYKRVLTRKATFQKIEKLPQNIQQSLQDRLYVHITQLFADFCESCRNAKFSIFVVFLQNNVVERIHT